MSEPPSPPSGPSEPSAPGSPTSRAAGPPTSRAPRSRAPGAYLRLALWQRLALSLGLAAGLVSGLVLYVSRHNTDALPVNADPAAELRANREAAVLERQDQAPHVARLPTGRSPAGALAAAVRAAVALEVARGSLGGPVAKAECTPAQPSRAGRRSFECRVIAGHVSYPFLGVVDTRARRITFCKRDAPPTPSMNVPVSRRCVA